MKWVRLCAVIILICLFSIALYGHSNQPSTSRRVRGKIMGVVLDANDARIPGAKITFWNPEVVRELKSGEAGEFEVELPAGTYQIKVEKDGFSRFVIDYYKVRPKVTELVNIHMEVWRSGPEPVPEVGPLETAPAHPSDKLVLGKP